MEGGPSKQQPGRMGRRHRTSNQLDMTLPHHTANSPIVTICQDLSVQGVPCRQWYGRSSLVGSTMALSPFRTMQNALISLPVGPPKPMPPLAHTPANHRFTQTPKTESPPPGAKHLCRAGKRISLERDGSVGIVLFMTIPYRYFRSPLDFVHVHT